MKYFSGPEPVQIPAQVGYRDDTIGGKQFGLDLVVPGGQKAAPLTGHQPHRKPILFNMLQRFGGEDSVVDRAQAISGYYGGFAAEFSDQISQGKSLPQRRHQAAVCLDREAFATSEKLSAALYNVLQVDRPSMLERGH